MIESTAHLTKWKGSSLEPTMFEAGWAWVSELQPVLGLADVGLHPGPTRHMKNW